jgi:hypothetical protein
MAAPVPGKKNHIASRKFAGEKIIRGRAEGGFDLDPFLVRKTFNVIQPAAANNTDSITRHGRFIQSVAAKGERFWKECRLLVGLRREIEVRFTM